MRQRILHWSLAAITLPLWLGPFLKTERDIWKAKRQWKRDTK